MTFFSEFKHALGNFIRANHLLFFPSLRPVLQTASPTKSFFSSALWIAFLLIAFSTTPEFAGAAGKIGKAIDQFVQALTGDVGTAIATLGVIIVGIGALLGKVSWGMALIVAVGVGVVFGAGAIVTALK